MAEAEKTEAQEEVTKAKSKSIPLVILVVLILLGLVLAGGVSYFVTTAAIGGNGNTASEARNHEPGTFVRLGDPKEGMIVNVGGIKASRFLKVGIVLELNTDKEDNVLEGKLQPMAETKIMDTTLYILRSVKIEELDASRQDDLKAKIKTELNKVLGEGSVYDVYITSFMLQ